MEFETNSESGFEPTVGLVPAKMGNNPSLFLSNAPRSSTCCGRRALVVGLVIAFAINTLLTIFALVLATASFHKAMDASSEIKELRTKLEEQKEVLSAILNFGYPAETGDMGDEAEAIVAESSRAEFKLGPEKSSRSSGNRLRLPAGSLLTESEEANEGGSARDETGPGAGTGGDGQKSGTQSSGDETARSHEAKSEPKTRKKRNAHAPIQDCNCDDPNTPKFMLIGCCCNKRAKNEKIYNRATLERYREILLGKAAGHFVACNPSRKDLNDLRPDGEMVAMNMFRSRTKDIFFGDEEPWSGFPSSRAAFAFDSLNNTLTIRQDGLYFVYVQVAHVMFTVSSLHINGVEWLRCQHRPPSDIYDLKNLPLGRESCNMYGVRPLLAGDTLRLRNGIPNLVAEVTMSHCTNFGIVKM